MKVRFSVGTKIFALALVAVAMAALAGGALHASNMGFKMNKVLYPQGVSPVGKNVVALPFRNPYNGFRDLCDAFGLTNATTIEQLQHPTQMVPPFPVDCGSFGANNDVPVTYFCDQVGNPDMAKRRGVEIIRPYNPAAVPISGILVGSHAGGPPGVAICADDTPLKNGFNRHPVLYHGTAATLADICIQAGLDSDPPGAPDDPQARVERIDAAGGIPVGYECGDAGTGGSLVLGEAVHITNQSSPIVPHVPPHF
jgi:hypothetical protein